MDEFPEEAITFLRKVITEKINPPESYWLSFEKKICFSGKPPKFTLAPEESDLEDKQIKLMLSAFLFSKVIAARLIMAPSDPSLFPGVPSYDLPYLKMCGMTLIAIFVDIVVDFFEVELKS